MKISKFALAALFVPMLILGSYHAEAAPAGSIEGGDIYQAVASGNEVTYKVRITNTGAETMHNVTVRATMPSDGQSAVTVCANNATPHCTSDSASSSAGKLVYVTGSTSGGSGNIFGSGRLQVGDLRGASERMVQFMMRKATPPAPASSGTISHNGDSSNSTAQPSPAPTHPAHTHQVATVSRQNSNQADLQNNETLPTVESNAGDVSADQDVNNSTENSTNDQATDTSGQTGKGADDLATSGSAAGMGALALGLVIGGAYYLRRSQNDLADAILNKN